MGSNRELTPLDFTNIILTAKIDYVTIATPGKIVLPQLIGTPRWSVTEHHKRLTIHDCAPSDLPKLIEALNDPPILELEIAVDAAPKHKTTRDAHQAALERLFDGYLDYLHPYDAPLMSTGFMGMFNPITKKPEPLDERRLDRRLQVIWGARSHPAQTKLYIKARDGNLGTGDSKALSWQQSCTRVEVRLSDAGLVEHGLNSLSDLQSFKVRQCLSPYLRIVRGSRRRDRQTASLPAPALLARKLLQKVNDEMWRDVGAPAFRLLQDPKMIVFLRDQAANARIGNALARLERQLTSTKFRRDSKAESPQAIEA